MGLQWLLGACFKYPALAFTAESFLILLDYPSICEALAGEFALITYIAKRLHPSPALYISVHSVSCTTMFLSIAVKDILSWEATHHSLSPSEGEL